MYYVTIPISDFPEASREYILENVSIIEKYALKAILNYKDNTDINYTTPLKVSITERGNVKIEFNEELVRSWNRVYAESTGCAPSLSNQPIINWFSSHIIRYLKEDNINYKIPERKQEESKKENNTDLEGIRRAIENTNELLKELISVLKKERHND